LPVGGDQQAVILNRGFGADATDDSEGFH
jgi:hypothetical protein